MRTDKLYRAHYTELTATSALGAPFSHLVDGTEGTAKAAEAECHQKKEREAAAKTGPQLRAAAAGTDG